LSKGIRGTTQRHAGGQCQQTAHGFK
jgi:hypothetical protein